MKRCLNDRPILITVEVLKTFFSLCIIMYPALVKYDDDDDYDDDVYACVCWGGGGVGEGGFMHPDIPSKSPNNVSQPIKSTLFDNPHKKGPWTSNN